jgi:site-specific recombinase XerD
MLQGWKNPIRRVKAPKVPTESSRSMWMKSIYCLPKTTTYGGGSLLLKICESNYAGVRDKAMMLGLLDTGARAKEFLNINLEDIELATVSIMIRQGKGRKPRMVFLGRKTIRAIRAYLRARHDNNPALWVSVHGGRMTYSALCCLLRKRAELVGLKSIPTPHDFRRAFALIMVRNGVDIFAMQKLMGHSDLQVLRRYLAQTDEDIHTAHMRHGPVDNNL